ncbi:hypothetical protein EJB05_13567 [Eragrostis curvula]|uniref:AAA+ ATPase domain-containing protein n=1 Tax=Eragrostis curvula TaxID=38414 RepID=A0A5J9VWX5_9POAL|nr:hypothetical protein EJB05_13567 [Eragrostis curvula]
MNLVTGAIGSLGPKLLQLLGDEYKLQSGLKSQVKFLVEELESVHAALRKVADVPWDQIDEPVKIWARQVRESSYDMEDVLDTFLVRVDSTKPTDPSKLKRAMKKMANLFSKGKSRRDIAVAIEDIKKQLQIVAERRARYKVDEIVARPVETVDPRLAFMYTKVTKLVGIGKALGDIISILETTKKVSIVGIGGLGKTTLAKASYDKLSSKYDYKAFVSVGRNPNLAKVFKDILYGLNKREYENIHNTRRGVDLLIGELREFLENKRYLIVIDDVWETSTWDLIETALVMESNCDNRVITTTRIVDIAKKAGDVYNMEPLSEAYSKELFCTRMGKDKTDDQLASKATEKILKKCGGIPLSIITIASLLVDKPVVEWYMVYDSIGFGPEGKNQLVDDMRKILLFSYYDLPPYLKTCLLHLSIYPEDTEIVKDEVIWQWIGEGFINTEDGKVLFQVAETYFNQLINKSMIQPVYHEYDGCVYRCRVHDMVLDLICILATEENFAKKLERVHQEHWSSPSQRSSAACVRRLALHGGSNQGQNSNLQPAEVAHLRHLGLSGTPVDELPRDIRNLVHLQSLHVGGTGLKELPPTVDELSNLMYLRLDDGIEVLPWLGKLTSLQVLKYGRYQSSTFAELGKLTKLRILWIVLDEVEVRDVKALVESLHHLRNIEDFYFSAPVQRGVAPFAWEPPRQIREFGWEAMSLPRLPVWLNPKRVPHLSFLELKLKAFEAQDMDILGSLPELRCLLLSLDMESIVSWTFPGGRLFPNLKIMRLKGIRVENVHLLELKNVRVFQA